MNQNIEIKARIDNFSETRALIAEFAQGPEILVQHDTFFCCHHGRLKLRVFNDDTGELIQYERPDLCGASTSRCIRVPVEQPQLLEHALRTGLGTIGVVRKRREVWMSRRTRIHLDRVEGLGVFLELEVVLASGEPEEADHAEAGQILDRLCLRSEQFVAEAYIDLPLG